ncbi:NAD-dependent deacetylase sirtuin-2 [Hypomontagnella monticulosa]|nr:NAD-dependent deacetylase sirtuin-2 [Hypomontagnella monticulosa]
MGQETSHLIDEDTPPETLSERSLRGVAEFIRDGGPINIVVMTGAGISTAAGIPDFRSPKTGLYHNLSRFNLPHPEAVFEIDFFRSNPEPFYLLAKELYPGNFSPTISHVFIALLAKKDLLRLLFTQNIDCLERAAGVPPEKIVEAHGSFATQRCIECRTPFPDDLMREHVLRGEPPRCAQPGCNGLVKPDIVFFGEQLPESFYRNISVPAEADLMLVMGTSLLVHPFAGLPQRASDGVPRVLFNLERVGDLGTRADDVLCLGDCDSGIRKLADELGWGEELESMWRDLVGDAEAERQLDRTRREEAIQEELEELTSQVEDKLGISGTGADGARQDEESEFANMGMQGTQGEEEGGPQDPTAGHPSRVAPANALPRVGYGASVVAKDGEGYGETDRGAANANAETKKDGGNEGRPTLSYEPLLPTNENEKERPNTADGGVKAEDKRGGEKPAL